jgi:outer membrane receptor protein involved in Fe transport
MTNKPTLRPVALAAALLALQMGAAHAQTAAAAPASNDLLDLDKVVITGTATARTKMQQSVSVSSINSDDLENAPVSSAAEALRAVPGLRAESSGGEGNANLGVRGLPMSDGGGRYVQLQEDGLPIMLFGDISFATADEFVRADYSIDGIDVLRGGSSSTLATNASGAIVNFQSRTGKGGGGAVGMSMGADYRQQRADFTYGGMVDKSLYFNLSGFYRGGEGVRSTNVTAENGGQIKASLTKEFAGGYVRVTLKQLNDKTPTYLPVPVKTVGNDIVELPGVNPRKAFFINSNFPQDTVIDSSGNARSTTPADGLAVNVSSIGVEAQLSLGDGWTATNRFRKSDITGRFIGVFPAGSAPTDAANGVNQYTGTSAVFSAHIFNTSLDDMGNLFNDLRLQKNFAMGGDKLTVTGGLFTGKQKIAQTWYWNRYNIELKSEGARLLDNAGNPSNVPAAPGTQTWGGCCVQNFSYDITAIAPYAAVTWEQGPLILDASVRSDRQSGTGYFMTDVGTTGVWDRAGATRVNYSTSGNSGSLGANYQLDRNLAVFARASTGSSWKSPDRVLGDARVATGVDPYPVNKVDQMEAGVKYRSNGLSAFVTAFVAKTDEGAGFEITSQTVKKNSYDSKGIEAEVGYRVGDFRVNGGATWTNASITSGANNGNTPRRQANLVYSLSPSYVMGPLEIGGSVIGTTQSYAQDDNKVVLPAYSVVNLFAKYELTQQASVSLGINNVFDTLAYTEAEGQGNLTNNPLYVARALNGRSAVVKLKYTF